MGEVRRSVRRLGRPSFGEPPRRAGCAFTLAELLVVMAVIAVLLGILVPSLSAAKERARLAACAVQMRGVGVGLKMYAAAGGNCMPPFAFSDHFNNLPLSGHWGGKSQSGDPDCFGRELLGGLENVNLWRLVADGLVTPSQLTCPGAACSRGVSGYFPYTLKFSTYCLRMLYSEDIFREAPGLIDWEGLGLLGIYTRVAGGVRLEHFSTYPVIVPYLRTDSTYRETDPLSGEQRRVELSSAAVLADTFWYQHRRRPAASMPGVEVYEVRAGWCHANTFNVLFGDGAVHAIRDNNHTVADNSVSPDAELPSDGYYFASPAIKVWRHFEDNR